MTFVNGENLYSRMEMGQSRADGNDRLYTNIYGLWYEVQQKATMVVMVMEKLREL